MHTVCNNHRNYTLEIVIYGMVYEEEMEKRALEGGWLCLWCCSFSGYILNYLDEFGDNVTSQFSAIIIHMWQFHYFHYSILFLNIVSLFGNQMCYHDKWRLEGKFVFFIYNLLHIREADLCWINTLFTLKAWVSMPVF